VTLGTVRGVGRVMSRTRAAGKRRKRWDCAARGCASVIEAPAPNQAPGKDSCPAHRNAQPRKIPRSIGGVIDWRAVQASVLAKGIELRTTAARTPRCLQAPARGARRHEGQIWVLHTLHPIGVAMAAADDYDPDED
jgi:tRNA-splicing ligase RtcB